MTTLVLVFKKIESKDKTKYNNFHLSSKAKAIINESNIENMFNYKIIAIIANIRKSLGKRSGQIIDSIIDHNISIYRYIKLPKESDHPRKGLINIQNTDDNKCFKWCFIRYLDPANHLPARLQKLTKNLQIGLILKNFQSKLEIFIKLKKRGPLALVVLAMKIKNTPNICIKTMW